MDKKNPSWKKELRTALAIPIVIMGIAFMAISFLLAMSPVIFGIPAAYEFARLQAIHNMLISIGFFLLAILIRVW